MDLNAIMPDVGVGYDRNMQVMDQVYKVVGQDQLICRIYQPDPNKRTASRGAILFYFGGGWSGGSIDQFSGQSKYLASKGLTCIVVDYRVRSRHKTTPFECIEDCRDSVQWVIRHSGDLEINPSKLVLIGGSAGGHVAISTFLQNTTFMTPHVKGLVLYNPVLDTSETGFGHECFDGRGIEASPLHLLRSGLPKTLIFHGTLDHTVPYEQTEKFVKESQRLGNSCELLPYKGADHGFFNFNKSPDHYQTTLLRIEDFLKEVGLL